jgi:hypothetical protein
VCRNCQLQRRSLQCRTMLKSLECCHHDVSLELLIRHSENEPV